MNTCFLVFASVLFGSGVVHLIWYWLAPEPPDLYVSAAAVVVAFGGAMLFLMMGAEL